ncbi:PTS glucose/sucrose transporter subunit IIB [Cellulomonas soli]
MAETPDVDALAAQVLHLVGGPDNVERLTHCWARLRFVLRDDSVADDDALGVLPGVVMVVRQSGQLQVALQSGPLAVHAALVEQLAQVGWQARA